MPNFEYYEDVKIIKKPMKKQLKLILIFFLTIVIFASVFFISTFLSDALSVGNISNRLVYGDTKITRKAHNYYAVTLGEYNDFNEATAVATGSTIRGASGYVWQDGSYFVIGSIYQNYNDANSVLENIKNNGYTVNVKEIQIPKINVSLDNYESKEVKLVSNALDFIDNTITTLYGYSVSFDKSETNNFAISSAVSSLRGDCKTHISNLQALSRNSFVQETQNTLIKLDENLNSTILKTIDNSTTNYSLKNAIAIAVRIKYDLYNKLSSV